MNSKKEAEEGKRRKWRGTELKREGKKCRYMENKIKVEKCEDVNEKKRNLKKRETIKS